MAKSKSSKKTDVRSKSKRHVKRARDIEEDIRDNEDIEDIEDIEDNENSVDHESEASEKIDKKTSKRLKRKISTWMDYDDEIKALAAKSKKIKDAKKQEEDAIIKMLTNLEIEDSKIDVHGEDNTLRGRVYRHKSITRDPLKESTIKIALMEAIRDEKRVDQLIKKIDTKRPIKERYYLKRTKGNKDD